MNSLRLDPLRAPLVHRRWLGLLSLLAPSLVVAGPTGGQVIAGQVSIGSPNAATTVVTQNSQTAVINWQQFNVGGQELVQFVQPSASAAILNRIVGGDPSEILGSLAANGRVFLINPQGLMFGAGSRVDVGGLMASTLDIQDHDFLAGNYVFAGNGSTGAVINHGRLSAADGGFIVLAGDSSRNTGLIQARLGDVVLASGSAMTLDLAGDGLVNYAVDGTALSNAAGVSNTGELLADGGRVLMTADVARSLISNAVNNSGLVRAASLGEQDGEIALLGLGGSVVNSGTLAATSAAGTGGDIRVLGDRDVLINGGLIDASGATGGGSVRIGGGREGGEGLLQADRTYIARDAVVRADATRKGDGGDIIAYSRNQSVLAGLLSARGGSQGGSGGFVETSSYGLLNVTRAPQVAGGLLSPGGQWLIDPRSITIVDGAQDYGGGVSGQSPFEPFQDEGRLDVNLIEQALEDGGNVVVTTANSDPGYGNGAGNITLEALLDFNLASTASLTFNAYNDILINNSILDSVGSDDNLNLTLTAGRDIKLGGKITLGSSATANLTAGGSILNAVDGDQTNNKLSANSINLTAVSGIGAGAQSATNRVLVAGNQISASVTGSGDLVLNSLSGQDVVFDNLSIAGSGLINANHRNGGNAIFSNVYVTSGSAQVGNINGSATVSSAHAGGSGDGKGTVLAFAGNATPVGGRNLTVGSITATESVELSADGDIAGSSYGGLNVTAPILNVGLTSGSVSLNTEIDQFSTVGAFGAGASSSIGILGALSLNESTSLRLGETEVGSASIVASNGQITQGATDSVVANAGAVLLDAGGADLKGTIDGSGGIVVTTSGGGLTGGGLFTSQSDISLYAFGDSSNPDPLMEVGKVLAGGSIYLSSGGAISIIGDDSSGNGVIVGRGHVDLSGDSISSSGNLRAVGNSDVSMSLYAYAGSVNVMGALGVYSDYGGASLDVAAYFNYVDADENGIVEAEAGTGNIRIAGSVDVRAATEDGGGSIPLYSYGFGVPAPVAAQASFNADGDLSTGDIGVNSYVALVYDLQNQGYGGASGYGGSFESGRLEAAGAELLINQSNGPGGGSVEIGSVQVSGYGDSTVRISGGSGVHIRGAVDVDSFAARYQRTLTVFDEASQTEQTFLLEDRQLGTASVDINQHTTSIGTLAGGYGGYSAAPDFGVEIDGPLSVLGPNALARIEAGTLRIGADDDGNSVTVQAYTLSQTSESDLRFEVPYHRVYNAEGPDQPIYSSDVAVAHAEFISTAAEGEIVDDETDTPVDSQLFGGKVTVSGGEAVLRLVALNQGNVVVGTADTEGGSVPGSVTVQAVGYRIDGNFFDYGLNEFNGSGGNDFESSGSGHSSLPPLDAPALGQFSDDAVTPYLQWGAGRLEVTGGSFDQVGGFYTDESISSLSIAGGLSVAGVGVATADVQSDTVGIGSAVTVNAASGAVFGELGQASYYNDYYYGNQASVSPETVVTDNGGEGGVPSGYEVIRHVSGDPEQLVDTGNGRSVAAATSAQAGISFEGSNQLILGGGLSVNGLAAEASMEGFESVTVNGAIRIDGRPEGSSPSHYREDVSYRGFGENAPTTLPPAATSIAIGGRSGMLINAGAVRLNQGVDIRGTMIAALLIESPDLQITGNIGIDAATGHIESNDTDFTDGTLVSADLGIAALRIGSPDSSPARLISGGGGSGNLTMTGTTAVQFGGVNLLADGDVLLQATNGNGQIVDSLSGIVLDFPHPLDYDINSNQGPYSPVEVSAHDEPTLNELLAPTPSACYLADEACSSRIETTVDGGLTLSASNIQLTSFQLDSAGSLSVAGSGEIVLGNIDTLGNLDIGVSRTGTPVATSVRVGNIVTTGHIGIGSLGDVQLGNTVTGRSITLTAAGDLLGPQAGNLSLTATSGDLRLDLDQIVVPAGLVLLSAEEALTIDAGALSLNGFSMQSDESIQITADTLSLTGGTLASALVDLRATTAVLGTGPNAVDPLTLANVSIDGETIKLEAQKIRLTESSLESRAAVLRQTDGNSILVTGAQGITLNDSRLDSAAGGLATLSAASGPIAILAGSSLDSSRSELVAGSTVAVTASSMSGDAIKLSGATVNLTGSTLTSQGSGSTSNRVEISGSQGIAVSNSDINSSPGGVATLSSASGPIVVAGSQLDSSASELLAGGVVTVTGSSMTGESIKVSGAEVNVSGSNLRVSGRSQSTLPTSNTVSLNGSSGITVSASSIGSGAGGTASLTSSAGAITVQGQSLVNASTIRMAALGSVAIENSALEVGILPDAKALTSYPAGLIELQGNGLILRDSSLSGGDVTLLGGPGTVVLDGLNIEGNVVRIEANAVTTPRAVQIKANGFGARGDLLDFGKASFVFGSGQAPFGNDAGLFARLPDSAAGLVPSSSRPNASFLAGGLLKIKEISGSADYIVLGADNLTTLSIGGNGVRGSENLFLQLIPGGNDDIAIDNFRIAQFARTLAIGSSSFQGNIFLIDPQRPVSKELGGGGSGTNYIFLTEGRVQGASGISTNGQVVVIDSTSSPQPPTDVPENIDNAPASDLVLVSDEFIPNSDSKDSADAVIVDQSQTGGGRISTDESSDAKQQCDAV